MSPYCAISPTSSAPRLRRRATTSSMSSTANMMRRMPSAFAGAFFGSARRRRVELRKLDPAVAVRGPHHGDVGTDAIEPDGAVHPTPLDRRLAFQLHPERGEERLGGLEVL